MTTPLLPVGTRVRALIACYDDDENGVERYTPSGSFGTIDAVLPEQEHCYSVSFDNGTWCFFSPSEAEHDLEVIPTYVGGYFIDTLAARTTYNDYPDAAVCKIVAVHCDDGATLIAENSETQQLWLTERSFLKPITEDEADEACLRLAQFFGMKPSWKDAPEWATYLAQDADGQWYWYQHKPRTGREEWFTKTGHIERARREYDRWTETLEPRPENPEIGS